MRFASFALSVAALLLSSCGSKLATGVKLDEELSAWVPSDTKLLAGLDADSLRQSDFYKRHQGELDVPALDEMSQEVGVDPRRDLISVLIIWNKQQPLILARGRFDAASLKSQLLSRGAKPASYAGQEIFGITEQAVFFPGKDIVAAGPTSAIRALLDRTTRGVPEDLRKRLGHLPKMDQVWIVSSEGLPLDRMTVRNDIQSALANLTGYVTAFDGGISFDAGARVHADLICTSATDAQQIHDAARGAIGFARLSTRSDEMAMLKLYDAIRVDNEQETVHIQSDLSPALTDQLVSLLSGPKSGRKMPSGR